MNEIFDLFLTQLNANDSNLVYKGNFLFRFFDYNFEVYETISGKLVSEIIEFSPVSLMLATPIVFTEQNKRIDWTLQMGLACRVAGEEYDSTVDLDYANIKSVCAALNGTVQTSGGKSFAFKVSPPDYQGYQTHGDDNYMIMFVTMSVTEIQKGEFSQATTYTIGNHQLDVTEIQITTTKRYHTADDKTSNSATDYNLPQGVNRLWIITFNYDPDYTIEHNLYKESRGQMTTLYNIYTLTETTSKGDTFNYSVSVRSGSEIYVPNSVRKLTIELVETKSI